MRHSVAVASALSMVLAAALPGAAAAAWRPRLGIEAGGSLTHMPTVALAEEESGWGAGFAAGLVAEWRPAPRVAVASGLRWERPVGSLSGSITLLGPGPSTRIDYDQRVGFDRLALPLRVGYRPGAGGFSIEGGLEAAWLAHAGRDADVTITSVPAAARGARPAAGIFEDLGTFDESDWTRHFHRWDLAASAGLGWDRPLGAPTLRVRARWQQGLVDIGKFEDPVRLGTAELTLGLLW